METLEKEKKKPFRRRFLTLSIEERIAALEAEAFQLKRLIWVRNYFDKVKHKQNSYIVEMRRQMAVRLFALGYTQSEIGRTFQKNHATILNLIRSPSDPRIKKDVEKYMDDWIDDGLYPETFEVWLPSAIHKDGKRTQVDYKLVKL